MILIDVNQLAIATILVALRLSKETTLDIKVTRQRVLKSLGRYKSQWKHRFGETVVCTDDKKYWRREIFPYYKASRKAARASASYGWNVIFYQINEIIQDLQRDFPMKVLRVERAEADDIIGSICNHYGYYGAPKADAEEILIVSGDKDMAQLLRYTNVHLYHPTNSQFVTNMNPARALHEHILRGDRGDGIPNFLSDADTFVSGKKQKPIFEVAMSEWLNKKPEDFCNDPQLVNYRRNELLIDLSKIPEDIQRSCVKALLEAKPASGENLHRYFVNNGLASLIGDIHQFI